MLDLRRRLNIFMILFLTITLMGTIGFMLLEKLSFIETTFFSDISDKAQRNVCNSNLVDDVLVNPLIFIKPLNSSKVSNAFANAKYAPKPIPSLGFTLPSVNSNNFIWVLLTICPTALQACRKFSNHVAPRMV